MADAKDCPKCGLVNPPSAQRCDCGYDFVTRATEQSYLSPGGSGRPDGGSRAVGYGCLLFAPLLLLSGVVGVINAAGRPEADGAGTLGYMCGAITPGLAALGFAAYLLRRR